MEVTTRIDYFTVTALRRNADKLWAEARECVKEVDRVLTGRYWRFFGYTGELWSDSALGHFAYGDSEVSDQMGVIAQASGQLANRYFDRFLIGDIRWSRIDIAVDVHLQRSQPDIIDVCYDYVCNMDENYRKYSMVSSTLGGQTLYVGSRQSEEFGRLYDKGIQAGTDDKGLHYRYEVELKRSKAKAMARFLTNRIAITGDVNNTVKLLVFDWFNKRDVPPIFPRNSKVVLDYKVELQSTSDERKLLWLSTQVAPAVKHLIMSGRGQEVLKALGIVDFYVSNKREDLSFDL